MRGIKRLGFGPCCAMVAGFLYLVLPTDSPAQTNPCAAKNPCAANNPCAAKNPCSPGGRSAAPTAKASMARGEILKVDTRAKMLILHTVDGKQMGLNLSKYLVVRQGPKVKRLQEVKRGEKALVSYVDSGGQQTAWFVYLASGPAAGNPCAANPCAAKAKKSSANPCAANPCAAKNPCAPKGKSGW